MIAFLKVTKYPVKVPDTDAKLFFNFLHENNICFKTFFTEEAFIQEYNNVQILKTIPIVINEYGREQAVAVGEQAVAVGEEKGEQQPNFLQKFTTYYEYPYYDAAGRPQQSCAWFQSNKLSIDTHFSINALGFVTHTFSTPLSSILTSG